MCTSVSRQVRLGNLLDGALVEQACVGNEAAFEVLVERYQQTLYRFATRFVDSEQAHDVLQIVWLQFYQALPGFLQNPPITSLKGWLFCITRCRCIDEMRSSQRRPRLFSEFHPLSDEEDQSLLSQVLDSAPQPDEIAERHDNRDCLRNAIKTLPPKFQAIVWLRYSQELSFNEIGRRLQMPPNTVKTYFHRARPLLRTILDANQGRTTISPFHIRQGHATQNVCSYPNTATISAK